MTDRASGGKDVLWQWQVAHYAFLCCMLGDSLYLSKQISLPRKKLTVGGSWRIFITMPDNYNEEKRQIVDPRNKTDNDLEMYTPDLWVRHGWCDIPCWEFLEYFIFIFRGNEHNRHKIGYMWSKAVGNTPHISI